MTARTRQAALCMEASPSMNLVDLAQSLRWLTTAALAVDQYRKVHDFADIDPRGDALDADEADALAMARSALAHHGIDADALRRAL